MGRLDITVSRDQTAPSIPGQPAQGTITQSSIAISWAASTDSGGSGLKGYDVERNGAVIAVDVPAASYLDTGLIAGATYTYRVRARDNAGNVSAFSASRDITTSTGASGPVWNGGSDVLVQNATVGAPINLDVGALVTGETDITLQSGALPGATFDGATHVLSGTPTTAGTYDLVFRATDLQGGALADWNVRTSAAGVLWAHRFQSGADVTRWQTADPMPGQTFESGRGIIAGDGCVRQTVLQRAVAGGGSAIAWRRPLQPQPGDINQPGAPEGSGASCLTLWNSAIMHGVMHPDYNGVAVGSPARTGISIGSDVYLQFRVRFSPGHFGSGMPYAKMMYITCNYQDPSQEYVLRSTSYIGSNPALPTMYTSWEQMFNSGLEDPQSNGPGFGLKEPGYSATCAANNPAGCWVWPENQWVTVMLHLKPGHQYVSTTLGDAANNGSRDTMIEMYVAPPGATSYTRIFSKADYVWAFDNGSQNGSSPAGRHPYGWTWMQFNPYTGGAQWAAQPADSWNEFDQVICSTQPIACPQV